MDGGCACANPGGVGGGEGGRVGRGTDGGGGEGAAEGGHEGRGDLTRKTVGNGTIGFYNFWVTGRRCESAYNDHHHLPWPRHQPPLADGLQRPPKVLDRRRARWQHPLDRRRRRPSHPARYDRPSRPTELYPRRPETRRIHHAWPRRYPHRTQPASSSPPAHPSASMPASFQTSACAHPPSSPFRDDSPLPISGGDLELLDWLTTYTFPAESKFKDLDYAERIYTDVVHRIIASGVSDPAIAASMALMALRRRRVATMVACTATQPCVSRTLSARKVIPTLRPCHRADNAS